MRSRRFLFRRRPGDRVAQLLRASGRLIKPIDRALECAPRTVAHQQLSQFGDRKIDAIASVGSTVIFRVDRRDAHYLTKDLMGKVSADDLTTLDDFTAVVRIGNQVVRVRTHPPLEPGVNDSSDRILQLTHERYCRPAAEVQPRVGSYPGPGWG